MKVYLFYFVILQTESNMQVRKGVCDCSKEHEIQPFVSIL